MSEITYLQSNPLAIRWVVVEESADQSEFSVACNSCHDGGSFKRPVV